MSEREPNDAWSDADDDLVRSALESLRADVDRHGPLPVAAIKARTPASKRSPWLMTGAGIAAAGLVVGAVALSGILRPDRPISDPANTSRSVAVTQSSTSSATSSSPTTSDVDWQDLLAAKKFLIPYAAEWTAALNLSSPVTVTNADDGLEDPLCAMPAGEGTLIDAQTITVAGGQAPFASQRVWAMGTAESANADLAAMAAALDNCSTPLPPGGLTADFSDEFTERGMLWSFAADTGTGWVALVADSRHISYLELWDAPEHPVTKSEMARIAWVAEQRLRQYGGEELEQVFPRHLTGPAGSMPSGNLFLNPDMFISPVFSGSDLTEAAVGEFEGSPAITQACDADADPSGVFALMKIKLAGKDASFFATQRIRKVSGTVDDAVERLDQGFDGCSVRLGQTTTKGVAGPEKGQYVLTTTFDDNSPAIREFVVVTPLTTPGYVSTILAWSDDPATDVDAAWAELARLGELAALR